MCRGFDLAPNPILGQSGHTMLMHIMHVLTRTPMHKHTQRDNSVSENGKKSLKGNRTGRSAIADAAPRLRAHTDYGSITLLFLDGVPGLEVKRRL